MTTIHQTKSGKVSYTKGAPDVLLRLCNRILINGTVQQLDRKKKEELLKKSLKTEWSRGCVAGWGSEPQI